MSVEKAIRGVLQDQIAPKEINEAGHDDVSMAKTKVKIAMAAVQKMSAELDKLPDDGDLPSWWVGKVAIAVDKLDGMADYLDTQVEEVEEELEEKKLTPAELKKREEVAKAIERENPKMPMDQKMAIATATAKKVAEATVNTADIEKHKNISQSDKDKIAKIADMMSKEKKNKTEAYNEPQGQAKSMMSPLHKARMDKEKADRDRDGKLKPGVVKVKKEEVEVEEAKKVSSMQIHKVLAPTKNSREGIAALKKAFKVNDREAQMMLKKVMNEETIDEISRSMTPMRNKFGGTVIPKKFDAYKKHMKTHKLDEPTVRMIADNPDAGESKRMLKNPKYAKAYDMYKAAHKESVDEVLDTPDRVMNYKQLAKYSRYRARNSQAAHMMRGTDPSKDKDTERKREKGLKTLNRNVAGKIRKAMMKNEKFANAAQQAAVMAKLKASGKYKKEEVQEAKKPDETVNIRQSLKKAIDMRGQKEVVFKDGSKAKISVQDAEKAMKMLDNTRMAKAKQDLTVRMMKSHQDFKDTLAGKKPKVDPFALRVRTNEEVISEDGSGYTPSSEKSKLKPGGHRSHLINPKGKTAYLGGTTYKTAKHAEGEAAAYHKAYFNTPGMKTNDRGAERAVRHYKQKNKQHVMEDNNPKIVRHLELAKKARAEGDYDKANYHTQLARQMQNEGTFISKFKQEIKEKKRMSETKGAPKGYHFTRSGQLKKGDAGQDGDGGKMLRSDPLDKQRKKIPPLPENDK